MKNRSRVQRISEELIKEIENVARKNNIKVIEASREVARIVKRNKERKMFREIKF